MRLASNQNSHSFCDSSFKLLIELIDTNSITEVENVLLFFFASEDYCDVEGNENIVIRRTGSHRESINNVLFRHQELDFCPWHAGPDKSTFLLNTVEFAVAGNNGIGAFGAINTIRF